jgi:hypothetical protein
MITKVQKYLLNKLPDKIRKNIKVIDCGCWLWQVNINGTGYGRISVSTNGDKKRVAAHIYIYKFFNGDYDSTLKLDHVYCKHRNCCNPAHVEPVTQKQNIHRGKAVLFKKNVTIFKLPPEPAPYLEDLLAQYAYLNR